MTEPRWIDRHSINCIECGSLVDERECLPGNGGEGDICPSCQSDEPAHAGDEAGDSDRSEPDLNATDYREELHRGYPEAGR